MQNKDGWTALMFAAQPQIFEVVKLLAKHETCMVNNDNQTALMIMCSLSSITNRDILKYLLQETKMQDVNGMTALMYAVKNQNVQAVKLLVRRELNLIDVHGLTAL